MKNKDICLKCKHKSLKQLYRNIFKCEKCLYEEEQDLLKYLKYKNTTIVYSEK